MADDFFDEQLPGSKLKSKIVSSYFWKWAKVMTPIVKGKGDKIGYLDFFCGPGKYEDGSDSTPLLILKAAINDLNMANSLVTIFNDNVESNVEKLEKEVNSIPGIEKLKHQPVFLKDTVGQGIVDEMKKITLIPSLIFIDPFGYKGLSLDLIASVIKDWGCDCIFFFNYNRINAAINNSFMEEHINSLFGKITADKLREEVKNLSPDKREELVLNQFQDELKKIRGEYSLSFKFYKEDSTKTSHFIFFVTKHPLGYSLMKQTMADNCNTVGGIPSYEYYPAKSEGPSSVQMGLFPVDEEFGIKKLAEELFNLYKGQTKTRKEIFEEHNIGKPYIENNYKSALLILEQEKRISVEPPFDKRRLYKGKPTLGENLILNF